VFLGFTAAAVWLLWVLPGSNVTVSSNGISGPSRYWWWLAMALFVTVGCAFELLLAKGIKLAGHRLSETVKVSIIVICTTALIVAYYSTRFHHR
jgi:uncharacterized membrane-anchored protein